jgi:hypothetical protein
MNTNTTQTSPPTSAKLSEPAKLLFWLAAKSHTLADQFGIEVREEQCFRCGSCRADLLRAEQDCPKCGSKVAVPTGDVRERMKFLPRPRPWLTAHQTHPNELTFDPDLYAETLHQCSDGENYMRLFILNVWNPSYARTKGWTFDLFAATRVLDQNNLEAIGEIIRHPTWP